MIETVKSKGRIDVLFASKKRHVVVFHALWSKPCVMFINMLRTLDKSRQKDMFHLVDIDTVESPQISALPTVHILDQGAIVTDLKGLGITRAKLECALNGEPVTIPSGRIRGRSTTAPRTQSPPPLRRDASESGLAGLEVQQAEQQYREAKINLFKKRWKQGRVCWLTNQEECDGAIDSRLVVLMFHSRKKETSNQIMNVYEALAAEHPDLPFCVIDATAPWAYASKHAIGVSSPEFHVYTNGERVDELQGASNRNLRRLIIRTIDSE